MVFVHNLLTPYIASNLPVPSFVSPLFQINYGRLSNPGASQNIQLCITDHTLSASPMALVPCNNELRLLDLIAGKTVKRLRGHFGDVFCVTGHPREQVCICVCMLVYMCMYVCVCMCVYVFMHVSMYMWLL